MREERLRTTAGLRGTPALTLSAWRGRSGRRYVVGIHELAEPDPDDLDDAVVMAVRRAADGTGELVGVASAWDGPRESLNRSWMVAARHRGANEMHIHRLAESAADRRAIVADLDVPLLAAA